MARRYSVHLKDGTTIEFSRKDQAHQYYLVSEAALKVTDASGATLYPEEEIVSTTAETVEVQETLSIVSDPVEGEAPAEAAAVEPKPKRVRKPPKPKAEHYEVGEAGGRFYKETYAAADEGLSAYQRNPRSILRWTLGCSWAVLAEQGLDTAKAATLALQLLEGDKITPDQLLTEGLPEEARLQIVTTPRVKAKTEPVPPESDEVQAELTPGAEPVAG